jgi:hypothetical protein
MRQPERKETTRRNRGMKSSTAWACAVTSGRRTWMILAAAWACAVTSHAPAAPHAASCRACIVIKRFAEYKSARQS